MRGLKHPHIVELLNHYQSPNHVYLVLEWVPGGSLASWVAKHGPVPEDRMRYASSSPPLVTPPLQGFSREEPVVVGGSKLYVHLCGYPVLSVPCWVG